MKSFQSSSFAVIYQGYLKPNRESEYQILWNKIARYFMEHRGAIGSCLHRTSDDLWLAYSRWPSKAVRDASWSDEATASKELPEEIRNAISALKDCIDQERKISEVSMEVIDDLLLTQSVCNDIS